jgi:site-specific recombinase XerD
MDPLIEALTVELAAGRRSSRTIATYTTIARHFLTHIGHERSDAMRDDVIRFLGRKRNDGGERSPSARNQELAALRALGAIAVRRGDWTIDPTADLKFVREAARTPTVLDASEVRRLFLAVTHDARSDRGFARNLAVLAVLSQLGLRVHEVVALDANQVDLASATLVAVRGKGGTEHDLPLNAPAVAFLARWLAVRVTSSSPALFLSRSGGRLGIRAVQRFIARLRVLVGTTKRITPHVLRHAFATIALTNGAELVAVSQVMRHASVATTQRYIHLIDRQRRDAVRCLAMTVPHEMLEIANDAQAAQVVDSHALSGDPANDTTNPLDAHGELGGVAAA